MVVIVIGNTSFLIIFFQKGNIIVISNKSNLSFLPLNEYQNVIMSFLFLNSKPFCLLFRLLNSIIKEIDV